MGVKHGQKIKREKRPVLIAEDDKEFSAHFKEMLFSSFEEFCKHVEIESEDAKGNPIRLSFHPDTWFDEQKDFIANRTGRDLVLKSRQIGMSTINFVYNLFFALRIDGAKVLCVLQGEQQAKGAWDTMRSALESLQRLQERMRASGYPSFNLVPDIERNNKDEIRFVGGSVIRIMAAKADATAADKQARSFRYHRAHLSELAYWSHPKKTLAGIMNAISPEGGEIVIESTPKSRNDKFYEMYSSAKKEENGFRVHFWPWYFHTRNKLSDVPLDTAPRNKIELDMIDPFGKHKISINQLAFWQMKAATLGLEQTLIDFPIDEESCWLAKGKNFLNPTKLAEKAAKERVDPISIVSFGKLKVNIFRHPLPYIPYIIGADIAWGTGADGCSAIVINALSNEVVATSRDNRIRPEDFGEALSILGKHYNDALVAPERNGVGLSTIRALHDAGYFNLYQHITEDGTRTENDGWDTNIASRPVMLSTLEAMINEDRVHIPCSELYSQLSSLVRVIGKDKVKAENKGKEGGKADDMAFALMIALEVRIRAAHRWANDGISQRLNRELSRVSMGRNVHPGLRF